MCLLELLIINMGAWCCQVYQVGAFGVCSLFVPGILQFVGAWPFSMLELNLQAFGPGGSGLPTGQ